MNNIGTTPKLTTDRLILRPLRESDLKPMHSLRSDPQSAADMGITLSTDEQVTAAYIEQMLAGMQRGAWLFWALDLKQSDTFIGSITIWNYDAERNKAELGYSLLPSWRHQGYMREALRETMRFSFTQLSLNRLLVYTNTNNTRSLRLCESCGFTYCGEEEEEDLRGVKVTFAVYSIDAQRWHAAKKCRIILW